MNRIFLLLCVLLLSSCNDHDEAKIQTLPGKWKLIETRAGTGTQGDWAPASTQEVYEFNADGTFTYSRYPDCLGSYTITGENRIDFLISCDGQTHEWGSTYTLDNYLTLVPADAVCYEGCLYRYRKI